MAYTPATLFRMTGGNKTQGPSLWLYKTADYVSDARLPGYFPTSTGMNVGDIILVSSPTQHELSVNMVASINAGVVTADRFL